MKLAPEVRYGIHGKKDKTMESVSKKELRQVERDRLRDERTARSASDRDAKLLATQLMDAFSSSSSAGGRQYVIDAGDFEAMISAQERDDERFLADGESFLHDADLIRIRASGWSSGCSPASTGPAGPHMASLSPEGLKHQLGGLHTFVNKGPRGFVMAPSAA